MRRLPVYLLVDTSGSMHGEAIEAVRNGLQVMLSALMQDPYALETAYLSVIAFDSSARQLTPLTELTSFQLPNLQANGMTAMGEALSDALPHPTDLDDQLRLIFDGRTHIGEEEGRAGLEQRIALVEEEWRSIYRLLRKAELRSFGYVRAVIEAYA